MRLKKKIFIDNYLNLRQIIKWKIISTQNVVISVPLFFYIKVQLMVQKFIQVLKKYLYLGVCICLRFYEVRRSHVYRHSVDEWVSSYKVLFYLPLKMSLLQYLLSAKLWYQLNILENIFLKICMYTQPWTSRSCIRGNKYWRFLFSLFFVVSQTGFVKFFMLFIIQL